MSRLRLPLRGPAVREQGIPLPAPGATPIGRRARELGLLRARRPLKRWRYVAAFGPELMLCAGDARIGPLPQRWWAVAAPGEPLVERTSLRGGGLRLDVGAAGPDLGSGAEELRVRVTGRDAKVNLLIEGGSGAEPVEVLSPSGPDGWIWTRKLAGVSARGTVALRGRKRSVELEAVVDDSVGYHERHTAWRWSAGVGRGRGGERVAWNLVDGVHDAPRSSERTVWVDGAAVEVGAAEFADDLSGLRTADGGALSFTPWAEREHRSNLLLFRTAYRQPFGTFGGVLPGGVELAEGYGVMEEHDVLW